MGYEREAKIYEIVSEGEFMPEFILDMSPEEFEKAGSKFANVGLHLAEMGLPEWENINSSIRFPFIIIEQGLDNGKEGKIVAGVSNKAAWKIKEILVALGVSSKTDATGKVAFNGDDCVGKQFKVLYTEQIDSRTPEEGGTGTKYTKAETAYPADTSNETLGI